VIASAPDPVFQLALRGAAALLFGAAALHKLRNPAGFHVALAAYGLLPAAALTPCMAGLIAVESAIAIACLLPGAATVACLAGALLLAVYSLAIAVNLVRGRRTIDCGCGGPGGERPLRGDLLLRNAGVAALLCIAALAPSARALVWLDAVTILGAIATLSLLYAALDVAAANTARSNSQEAPAWALH
jgi:hypothetical protein